MFGKRSDGVKIKYEDILVKMTPHFMKYRNDADNQIMHPVRVEDMDAWIKEKSEKEGIVFNYMHCVMATIVRLLATRQRLNRFVVRGAVYQRNSISISLTIKRSLRDEGAESTIKVPFTGEETIYEVKEKIDKAIKDSIEEDNKTQKVIQKLAILPNWLLRFAIGTIKWLDNRNMLPKSIINASPFHTSVYVTYLKSIRCDAVLHHLYNFGTTGIFVAIGKEKYEPVVDFEELKVGKVMNLGITMDERFCDGFYFAKSLRIWNDMFHNLSQLEKPYKITDNTIINQKIKNRRKAVKIEVKKTKKTNKKNHKINKKEMKKNNKEQKREVKDAKKVLKTEKKKAKKDKKLAA